MVKVNQSTLGNMIGEELLPEFPEHAKMAEHTQANWDIRDFMSYMHRSGVLLLEAKAGQVHAMDFDSIESRLLLWRGVDQAKYRQEGKELMLRYGGLVSSEVRRLQSLPEEVTLRQACDLGIIPVLYNTARKRMFRSQTDGEPVPEPVDPKATAFKYRVTELVQWNERWEERVALYVEKRSAGSQAMLPLGDEVGEVAQVTSPSVPVDPKQSLMDKIKLLRGEGEDDEAQVA